MPVESIPPASAHLCATAAASAGAGMLASKDVLHFWFEEVAPKDRFAKDSALDETIRERFAGVHARAAAAELYDWRQTPAGRLAEIVVLDQFSRNMFRDSAQAFAQDALALVLAQEAVACGADKALSATQRQFLYMPYMHSESLLIQEQSLVLFDALGNDLSLEYARRHHEIIARFGRYPHRNVALGRASTEEERAFLQQPGSSF